MIERVGQRVASSHFPPHAAPADLIERLGQLHRRFEDELAEGREEIEILDEILLELLDSD